MRGGAIQAIQRLLRLKRIKAGITNPNSPIPSRIGKISVSAPWGQPPPGSTASKGRNPVDSLSEVDGDTRPPRQMSRR